MSDPRENFLAINHLQFLLSKVTVQTQAMDKMAKILDKTHSNSSMVGILGEEGLGKSSALAKYIFNRKNVFYIKMGQSSTYKAMFHELVFLLTGKFPFVSTNMYNTIGLLSNLLTEDSEKKLIVVDDAGKLRHSTLGLFHELRDNTMSTTGFAFLGPDYFMNNLIEWRRQRKIGIGEFYRRMEFWYSLPHLTEQEKVAYMLSKQLSVDDEIKQIMREVTTIWELESRANIYIEKHKKRKSS